MTITETNTPNVDNGVDVVTVLGARQHMTDDRSLAEFQFRAHAEWVDGTHTRSTVETFTGAGGEQAHRQPHTVETDHPTIFAAADNAMSPPEMMLAGLAGCLTAGIASVATNRGIQLRSVRATMAGDIDLAGILGIDADVRNGFSGIRVNYEIDADASRDDIAAVVAQSQKRSAVFDVITNPTAVVVELV